MTASRTSSAPAPLLAWIAAAALAAAGLLPGRADAVVATYRWQLSNGASVGGMTTNWTQACGGQPAITTQRITTMSTAAFGCTSDRLTDTATSGAAMLLLVSSQAYSQATTVTGQATGSVWSLQNAGGTGPVAFGFQLGYVSGGAFNPFAGQVNQTVTTTQTTYTPNLSSLTGTVPANAFVALRIQLQQNASGAQARISFANAGSGGGVLAIDETPVVAATTTVGNGSAEPPSVTLAPGAAATMVDAFTLQTSAGTDSVSAATVTLGAGTSAGIQAVEITSDTGAIVYGSVTPSSDSVTVNLGTAITATTTLTQYKVRVTPKAHSAMAAPPGASYAVTARVTAVTSSLAKAYADTGSATVTIDNLSPPDVAGAAATAGDGSVTVAWTSPAVPDFSQVVILQLAAPGDRPAEGASYVAGAAIGASRVVHAGTGASYFGIYANGSAYTFALFARDASGNYAQGVQVTATPQSNAVVPGTPTAAAASCNSVTITAPFTGDPNNNSTISVARDVSPGGPFATVVCPPGSGGTSNPRSCVDAAAAESSSYYYRVTYADPDGAPAGASPLVTPLVTTPVCGGHLVLSTPGPQIAGTIPVGGGAKLVGQVTLAASSGTLALASLAVTNAGAAPRAVAGSDIQALTLADAAGNVLAVSRFDGARYVFTSPTNPLTRGAFQVGTTAVTLGVTATAAYGATVGRTFAMGIAPADVVAAPVAGGSAVTGTSGGSVAGSAFTLAAPAGIVEGDPTPRSTKPGVAIFNPGKGAVVSGSFLLQVLVQSPTPGGAADVTAVGYSTTGTSPSTCAPAAGLARNVNYDGKVGTNATMWQKVLTFGAAGADFPSEGAYTLVACAANASGSVSSAPVTVTVRKAGTGDGNLLVRDNSSQLCADCHALQTHSSGNTSNKYGSWTVNCRDCHDPHKTRNLFLLREGITPPAAGGVYQPLRPVYFANRNGDSTAVGPGGGAANPGSSSYVNEDSSGPCQVCHTRTSSADGTVARWRNTGNADVHQVGLDTTAGAGGCAGCHSHANGFKPGESAGGAACGTCHTAIWATMTAAGTASKHSLVGATDTAADNGTAWNTATTLAGVAPAQRSCVSMCHGDHPHNTTTPAGTTHEYNLVADPSTAATRQNGSATRTAANRANVDFDPVAKTGLCTRCHEKPVDVARPAVTAAGFGASAHNFTSTAAPAATWEYVLHDGAKVARNCTKCHASRVEGTTPSFTGTALGAVHGSSDPSLLAGTTNPGAAPAGFVCYNCHGNGTIGKDLSGKVIYTEAAKAQGHGGRLNASTTHSSASEDAGVYGSGLYSGANRHVNCLDCHDQHLAGKTKHSVGPNDGAITATSPLNGASGVGFTATLPALWGATGAANLQAVNPATTEWQICFKCHSSWAWSAGTPPTGPSTLAETDLAQEFNPNNRSAHPVVNTLANQTGSTGAKGLVAAQLLAPWNVSPGAQTMACSDCHNTDAASPAAQGPHGSAVPFMLTGTNRAWPYMAVGTTGTLRRINDSESNLGRADGLFCRNCHPAQTGSASNALHRQFSGKHGSDNAMGLCASCHLRVPHGGKVSRLIVTPGAPARYKAVATPNIASFVKAAKDSYDVRVNVRSSCGEHTSGGAGGEAW
jgi:hypothetical protein